MNNKTLEQEAEELLNDLISEFGDLFGSRRSYQYSEYQDYIVVYHMFDGRTIKKEILSKESFFHYRLQGKFPNIVKYQES